MLVLKIVIGFVLFGLVERLFFSFLGYRNFQNRFYSCVLSSQN